MELKPGYKQTEVGAIPQKWEVDAIGDAFNISGGVSASRDQLSSNGHCYLHYGDIHKSTKSFIDVRSEYLDIPKLDVTLSRVPAKSLLADGDVVFVDASEDDEGTSKHLVIVNPEAIPYISGLHTIVAKSKTSSFDNAYKRYCFQTRDLRRQFYFYSVGTKVSGISKTNIKKVFIPRPPIPEQRAIAGALSDVDSQIGALDQLITKKRDFKQAAMQQLLTGQTRLPGFSGEWHVKRLGEIALPRVERIDPRRAGIQDFCVELEHIGQANGQLQGSTATNEHSSLKSVFRVGDVLFGKLRAYLRKYWLADRDGVCSTEIWVLIAQRQMVAPEFLFQIVQTDNFIEVASTAYGTHMPRSDWNVVKNYEVGVPSVNEQTAIAAVLSDMDAEIAALEARLAKTRALKQGMMQELLTGKTRLV